MDVAVAVLTSMGMDTTLAYVMYFGMTLFNYASKVLNNYWGLTSFVSFAVNGTV